MRCAHNQVCASLWVGAGRPANGWHPGRPAWKAAGSLHRAPATASATLDAEGAFAPVVAAIVGIMGGGPGARLEGRPALERVSTSLPASAVTLAPQIAG